jgi:CRP-like cAMP-binding protein
MDGAAIATSLSGAETGVRWKPGATIFRQGDLPGGAYLLRSGTVELIFEARSGEAKPFRLAGPGQILGLSSVVMRRPHDCSARVRTTCEIAFIEGRTFLAGLETDPTAWLSVLELLSSEVDAAYDDMRNLSAHVLSFRAKR